MASIVARISKAIASDLITAYPNLDIQIDGTCEPIIHKEVAEAILSQDKYSLVNFEEAYIGSPIPRKKPKN